MLFFAPFTEFFTVNNIAFFRYFSKRRVRVWSRNKIRLSQRLFRTLRKNVSAFPRPSSFLRHIFRFFCPTLDALQILLSEPRTYRHQQKLRRCDIITSHLLLFKIKPFYLVLICVPKCFKFRINVIDFGKKSVKTLLKLCLFYNSQAPKQRSPRKRRQEPGKENGYALIQRNKNLPYCRFHIWFCQNRIHSYSIALTGFIACHEREHSLARVLSVV